MIRRRLMGLVIGVMLTGSMAACGGSAAPARPAPSATHSGTSAAAAPAAAAPAAPAAASPSSPLVIHAAYASTAGAEIPLQAAAYGGYFTKNHLNVKVTRINGGSIIVTSALLAGSIQMAQIGADAPLAAEAKGGHILVLATHLDRLDGGSLWGGKTVTTPAQLKGKVAAVTGPLTDTDFALNLALQDVGLKYGVDVRPLFTGGLQNSYAALLKGEVAGAIFFSPFTVKASKAGFHELLNLAKVNIPFAMNGLVTTESFAKQHPSAVVAFLRSWLEAIQRVKADPAFAKAVWKDYLHVTNPAELNSMYQAFGTNLANPPTPSVAGLQTVVRLEKAKHPGYAKLNLNAIVAPQYLAQAEKTATS